MLLVYRLYNTSDSASKIERFLARYFWLYMSMQASKVCSVVSDWLNFFEAEQQMS